MRYVPRSSRRALGQRTPPATGAKIGEGAVGSGGRVAAWVTENVAPQSLYIEGVENHLVCERIVVAIGQSPELAWLPTAVRERITNDWGGIKVDEHGMSTVPGVFAGGDLVNDTADAVSAIADGLRAVEGIQRFILDK